jgi:hypothetical protein
MAPSSACANRIYFISFAGLVPAWAKSRHAPHLHTQEDAHCPAVKLQGAHVRSWHSRVRAWTLAWSPRVAIEGGPGLGGEGDGDLAVDDVDGADQVTGEGDARDLTVSREPVVGDRDLLAGRDGSR